MVRQSCWGSAVRLYHAPSLPRSWRIGQDRPVRVVFMAYRNTLQTEALKLVARKLQSSLAVEGELPADGLAAFGDDGDDLMLALARKIVSGEEDEGTETVEAAFAQARDAEATAEEFLADDGCKAVKDEPEPVVAGVHRSGTNAASGGASGCGVSGGGTGRLDAEASGDGGSIDGQRSLFSWAEFMAEELGSRRQNGRLKPASASLFDWALTQRAETEDNLEPVGTAR